MIITGIKTLIGGFMSVLYCQFLEMVTRKHLIPASMKPEEFQFWNEDKENYILLRLLHGAILNNILGNQEDLWNIDEQER